jgi:hypothetical protein
MTKKEHDVILEFMRVTIEKVNACLSNLYVLQKIIIEKRIISEQELIQKLNDSKALPRQNLGKKTLEEMLNELNKNQSKEI